MRLISAFFKNITPILKQSETIPTIRTIDKKRLREKVGYTDEFFMKKVNEALLRSVGV